MSMLVAELLELARLDRPSSLDLSETDLTVLARDAVADARAVEPDREVTASVPGSLVVTADEPRIRQVLANLLGNVRAHTPPGTPATVRVYEADPGPDAQWAVIEVSDEGPGMPESDAVLAFDRFHRGGTGPAATPGRPPQAATASRRRAAVLACRSCRLSPPRTAATPNSPPPPAGEQPSARGSRSRPWPGG